jgi:hypothetical protein
MFLKRHNYERQILVDENIYIDMKDLQHWYKNSSEHKTLCWWCRHSYNSRSLGLPTKIDYIDNNKKDKFFYVDGFFCSFPCLVAFADDRKIIRTRYLIRILYNAIHNEKGYEDNISPAVSWQRLKDYGGDLTIEEFRKISNISTRDRQCLSNIPLIRNPEYTFDADEMKKTKKKTETKEVAKSSRLKRLFKN